MSNLQNTQAIFDSLAQKKENVLQLRERMIHLCDWFLCDQSEDKLNQIMAVLNENADDTIYESDSDLWRIHYLLNLLSMEADQGYPLFSDSCHTFEELKQKLILSVFSMRRMELQLNEQFLSEGLEWFYQHTLSPFAVIFICNREKLFQTDTIFYEVEKAYLKMGLQGFADDLKLFKNAL